MKDLSDTELEVLQALWRLGPTPVRGVLDAMREAGRDWAYTTAKTVLDRLVVKGVAAKEAVGPRSCYRALATESELIHRAIRKITPRRRPSDPVAVVRQLIGDLSLSPSEVARLRELVDRLESGGDEP